MTAQGSRPTSASPSRQRIPKTGEGLNRPFGARPYLQPRTSLPVTTFESVPTSIPTLGQSSATRSALIIGLAYVVSRVLGLLRDILLFREFEDNRPLLDAYVAAFRIPDLVFLGVMSVAFGAAFIPVFGGFIANGDEAAAWKLASAVIQIATAVTIVLCLIAFAFADPIMRQMIDANRNPEVVGDAVRTMRLLLLSPLLIGFGIAAKGILESRDFFTLPAIAPVLYNIAILFGVVVLAPSMGIEGVALGAVVGAGLHFGIQIPGLIRSGFRFAFTRAPQSVEGVRTVLGLLGPRVIGQAAFQLNFIWVTSLATRTGDGNAFALNVSWQMLMLPHGLIALSISTVVFPRMARLFEQGKTDEVRAVFTDALKPLLFLTIPASIGLFEFRDGIVNAFYRSKASVAGSAEFTNPIAFLALGLVFYGLVEVAARIFYAMKDTRTPVIAGQIIIAFNMVFGYVFLDRLGLSGLAIGLTASTGIEALILMGILRHRVGGLDRSFGDWLGRVLIAAAVMTLVAEWTVRLLNRSIYEGGIGIPMNLVMLVYAATAVGSTYLVAAWILKIPEMLDGIARARRLAIRIPILGQFAR